MDIQRKHLYINTIWYTTPLPCTPTNRKKIIIPHPNEHIGKIQCDGTHNIIDIQGWQIFISTNKYNILLQLPFPSPLEPFMERLQDTWKGRITCNLTLVWRSIAYGVTAQNARTMNKYWRHWNNYCKKCITEPYLRSVKPCEQEIIVTEFSVRGWTRAYSQGDQVHVQSFTDALAVISRTCQLVWGESSIYQTEEEYILPNKSLTRGFRRQDTLSIPHVEVPKEVPEMAQHMAYLTGNPKV